MIKYEGQFFEIELETGWQAERDENCYVIYHPDGVGALQISVYIKDSPVTDDDLIDNTGLDEEAIKHLGKDDWGDFSGFQLVYATEGKFWRKWWLKNGNIFLFVTYNCNQEDEDSEPQTINKMVSTLSLKAET